MIMKSGLEKNILKFVHAQAIYYMVIGSYEWIIMLEKCGRPDPTVFHLIWVIGTYGNWKIKILGALLELPAK